MEIHWSHKDRRRVPHTPSHTGRLHRHLIKATIRYSEAITITRTESTGLCFCNSLSVFNADETDRQVKSDLVHVLVPIDYHLCGNLHPFPYWGLKNLKLE